MSDEAREDPRSDEGSSPPEGPEVDLAEVQAEVPVLAVDRSALERLLMEESSASLQGRPFGRFVLDQEIARGSTSVVFKARQKGLGREVALKLLLSTPMGEVPDDEDMARFTREAVVLSELRHPNIVTVHDAGTAGSLCYFAMELVNGVRLADLADLGRLHIEEVLPVVRDLARALAYLHEQDLVHGDVDPGNVLLDVVGRRAVLVDFGQVHQAAGAADGTTAEVTALDSDDEAREMVALGGFSTPELVKGQTLTPLSDVYGLGGVLYFLISGQAPHVADDVLSLARAVVSSEPDWSDPRWRQVPSAIHDLAVRCLSRDEAGRPTGAAVVADRLDHVLSVLRSRRETEDAFSGAQQANPGGIKLWEQAERAKSESSSQPGYQEPDINLPPPPVVAAPSTEPPAADRFAVGTMLPDLPLPNVAGFMAGASAGPGAAADAVRSADIPDDIPLSAAHLALGSEEGLPAAGPSAFHIPGVAAAEARSRSDAQELRRERSDGAAMSRNAERPPAGPGETRIEAPGDLDLAEQRARRRGGRTASEIYGRPAAVRPQGRGRKLRKSTMSVRMLYLALALNVGLAVVVLLLTLRLILGTATPDDGQVPSSPKPGKTSSSQVERPQVAQAAPSAVPEDLLRQARGARTDLERLRLLDQALALRPSAEGYIEKSRLLQRRADEAQRAGKVMAIRAQLIRALGELDAAHRRDSVHMGVILERAKLRDRFPGLRQRALEDYSRLVARSERGPVLDYASGRLHLERGAYAESADSFKRAAVADPTLRADAMAWRAAALRHDGDLQGALAAADGAIAEDSRHAFAVAERALILLERDERGAALRDADQAVTLNVFDDRCWLARARVRMANGQSSGALSDLNRVLELVPNQIDALHSRARLRLGGKDFEGACDDLSDVLRQDPEHVEARRMRAEAQMALGRSAAARADLDRLLRSGQADHSDYRRRAEACLKAGSIDDAIADYSRALKISERDVRSLVGRARARHRQGDRHGAIDDLGQALDLEPGDGEALLLRSALRSEDGDFQAALRDLERAMAVLPARAELHEKRGDIFFRLEDYAAAEGDYDLALRIAPSNMPVLALREKLERARRHRLAKPR